MAARRSQGPAPAPPDEPDPLSDAFFEASRGLWASAAESFERAAERDDLDPLPVLGAAVAQLKRGHIDEALLLLETSPVLKDDHPYRARARWLCAAARLRAGDPLGAQRVARQLDPHLRLRVLAACALRSGDWGVGLAALLRAYGPRKHLE